LGAPVGLLEGIGGKTAEIFAKEGVTTIYDLREYEGNNKLLRKFSERVRAIKY
jgi:nucleotidyltransferase/DNA polymerase involved in DNA repair